MDKNVNFVILFEGTGNSETTNPSIISRLKKNYLVEDEVQYVFISKGSGLNGRKAALLTGSDWNKIIKAQYEAISNKRKELGRAIQDIRFYVFGFSRGAYQAKVFINGICRYGLELGAKDFVQKLRDGAEAIVLKRNKKPRIKFVGLIDTVCETRKPPKGLQDPEIPDGIEVRHALALNEYRKHYIPQMLKKNKHIEECWFLGAHADVGWAYNNNSDGFLINLYNKIFNVNCAETKTFGKIVVAWLLDEAKKVDGNLKMTDNVAKDFPAMNAQDYLFLTILFPYLIHNSYKDVTNIRLVGDIRRRKDSSPLDSPSVCAVRTILQSSVFDGLGDIPTQVVKYKKHKPVQKLNVRDVYYNLLKTDGGDVVLPVSVIDANRKKTDKKMKIKTEITGILKKITTKEPIKTACNLLKDSGLISNSWEEELAAMCKRLVARRG